MRRMLFVAAALVLTAAPVRAEPDEAAVIESLKKLGDVFVTPSGKKARGVTRVDLRIHGMKEPAEVAAAVKELAKLPRLQFLTLAGLAVTDEAAREVARLKGLRTLALHNTAVTDEGMKALAGLPEVQRLAYSGTRLTDAGLKHLGAMKRLTFLEIIDAPITDDGLMALAALPQLGRLTVSNGRVTEAGIARLRQALPGLEYGERFLR